MNGIYTTSYIFTGTGTRVEGNIGTYCRKRGNIDIYRFPRRKVERVILTQHKVVVLLPSHWVDLTDDGTVGKT